MLLNSISFANLRKKTYIAKFLTFYRGQLLFDHATPFRYAANTATISADVLDYGMSAFLWAFRAIKDYYFAWI